MDEKLIDEVEVLEKGAELVEDVVTDSNMNLKTVGKYGLGVAGIAAAGFGIYKGVKFLKKKYDEHKAKNTEEVIDTESNSPEQSED